MTMTDMFVITATALGTSESLYQCMHSREQTGQVYTPNIPDFYFNDMNAANFRTGRKANLTAARNRITYIFPIPSESPLRNCSGTVVSLQYCYQARKSDIRNNRSFFINFLSLIKNGLEFTVSNKIQIRTSPQNRICTRWGQNQQQIICCDSTSLQPTDRFMILPTNYSFGVVVRSLQLLTFAPSAMEYRAEQYLASLGVNGPNGTFMLTDANRNQSSSLLLLRFFIGKNN